MDFQVIDGPDVEPIELAAAKLHLKQDIDEDDPLIRGAIRAARTWVENHIRRKLITQTVRVTMSAWGNSAVLQIPIAPVQSIAAINYTDTAGVSQTWASSDYRLVKSCHPYGIAPVYGGQWPDIRADFDSVQIDMVCGYGDNPEDVPSDIIQAAMLMVGHFYENRQEEIAGTIVSRVRTGAEALLAPHRLYI